MLMFLANVLIFLSEILGILFVLVLFLALVIGVWQFLTADDDISDDQSYDDRLG